eukprot:201483_1
MDQQITSYTSQSWTIQITIMDHTNNHITSQQKLLLRPTDDKIYNKITQNHKQEQFQTEIVNKNDLSNTQTPHGEFSSVNNDMQMINPSITQKRIYQITQNCTYKRFETKITTDNTSIKSPSKPTHPRTNNKYQTTPITKLNTKSHKKDASMVSNPNDTKLQYNKNKDENSLEINNASLAQNHTYKKINSSLKSNKITLKQSLNSSKDCDTLPSTKLLTQSTQ